MDKKSQTTIRKFWNFCGVLRDKGLSYHEYVEQLTYLLFLKMVDEKTTDFPTIPMEYSWKSLINKKDTELLIHYNQILSQFRKEKGLLGTIFRDSANKILDADILKRLIELIDAESWQYIDVGDIYEELLQRQAEDVRNGAGQYFTPRVLCKVIIEVMRPKPGMTICDPACGTGGFLIAAYNYLTNEKNYTLTNKQKDFLKFHTFRGTDIVSNVVSLCAMNFLLKGIGSSQESPITVGDSLIKPSSEKYEMVLTNPPFGKKSSITIIKENGKEIREPLTYERSDFWVSSSNKQINFLQHVKTLLKEEGRAAIVIPDNVLFEGGAGEIVRKKLLEECNVHTLLRLPAGIFYSHGIKANVLFFDKAKKNKEPCTKELWIYDFRTNIHFTLKTNQLKYSDLENFVKCYHPEDIKKREETDKFKKFSYDELISRDKTNLDIFWFEDENLNSKDLSDPEIIAADIAENLETALQQIKMISEELA
jgi:type I restriction enzyme M protein